VEELDEVRIGDGQVVLDPGQDLSLTFVQHVRSPPMSSLPIPSSSSTPAPPSGSE
jgi:hypothetical protein